MDELSDFNPRSSYEERLPRPVLPLSVCNFNPRSSYEERLCLAAHDKLHRRNFNPRSSYEERPQSLSVETRVSSISIHAPHTRSDKRGSEEPRYQRISIHAPHTRSDVYGIGNNGRRGYISIHAPHTRSDACHVCLDLCGPGKFQSTLLIRGATPIKSGQVVPANHFNPRSSYEERRFKRREKSAMHKISIHAPHTRSDVGGGLTAPPTYGFQSTLLIRGATDDSQVCRELVEFQSTLLIRGATRGVRWKRRR